MTTSAMRDAKDEAERNRGQRMVVTALHKLLIETSLERLYEFLHRLHMRVTVTTTDKGLYVCRVFKQENIDGEVRTVESYSQGGKTPHAAIVNAIADFLAFSDGDFHDYMNAGWASHPQVQSDSNEPPPGQCRGERP